MLLTVVPGDGSGHKDRSPSLKLTVLSMISCGKPPKTACDVLTSSWRSSANARNHRPPLAARLVIDGADPQLTADRVTMTAGTYTPTQLCDDGLVGKLEIPAAYLRRLRATPRTQ